MAIYYYRKLGDRHLLFNRKNAKTASLSHYEIGQRCLFEGDSYQTYDGQIFDGDGLIEYINRTEDQGPEVAIPARSQRSRYGRSID